MSAVPKADVQNVGVGIVLNVCFWPKAAVRNHAFQANLNDRFTDCCYSRQTEIDKNNENAVYTRTLRCIANC